MIWDRRCVACGGHKFGLSDATGREMHERDLEEHQEGRGRFHHVVECPECRTVQALVLRPDGPGPLDPLGTLWLCSWNDEPCYQDGCPLCLGDAGPPEDRHETPGFDPEELMTPEHDDTDDDTESFNGPSRRLGREDDLIEQSVYCVDCGTVYVPARGRDCPNCTIFGLLDEHAFDPDGLSRRELRQLARMIGEGAEP